MDSPRGWLPSFAARPFDEPPIRAFVDVRVFEENGIVRLEWRTHRADLSQLPSATGGASFAMPADAIAEAERLFGMESIDWVFAGDGRAPTASDVASIRDTALTANEVDLLLPVFGLEIPHPELAEFKLPNGDAANLWLVLGERGDGYVVFYDPDTGGYGLAAAADSASPTYIADYGSLWETLECM